MFNPGQALKNGNYKIIQLLGSGGFGITYLAEDSKYNRPIVIKTLNYQRFCELYQNAPNFQKQWDEAQEKFLSEAITLASFDHPHIVKAYPQVFQEDGLWCSTMEYIEGQNLIQALQARGQVFPEAEALRIISQIGDAVSFIHSKGYLHRDIKPQNILLQKADNQAILIDFGLAREVNFAESMSLTSAQTPAYAPPEQFEDRANFTPALDIYSLAATLYVLVAIPKSPFTPLPNPFLNAWVMWDMNLPQMPPKDRNPALSDRVNDAILQGMALEVSQRPQSVQEWLDLLIPPVVEEDDASERSDASEILKTFSFEVVTVNRRGQITKKETKEAQYYTEILPGGVELEMVAIPGGIFWMGTEEAEIKRLCKKYGIDFFKQESPQHQVTISAFYMGRFPITQAQYQAIMGNNPSNFKSVAALGFVDDSRPVEQVSWNNAVKFCQKLSQATGKDYRLPAESQWEYACRAGTTTPFHFGETLTDKLANYDAEESYANEPEGQYRQQTALVGNFRPNAFGLYDMHGNVWEWCGDDWESNYSTLRTDEYYQNGSNIKVLRGGSWIYLPDGCRSASRIVKRSNLFRNDIGFRVMCVASRTSDIESDSQSVSQPESSSVISIPAVSKQSLIVPEQNLKTFSFEVVTVNHQGKTTHRETKQAEYYTEILPGRVGMDIVAISGDTYWMGTDDAEIERLRQKYNSDELNNESPRHRETISPFCLGKYPVTQAQWEAIMGNNPSRLKGKSRPVEQVSWNNAVEFCERLSQATGKDYRLPSEAEWEYACRAGTDTPFYFGETITDRLANYRATSVYANEPKGRYRRLTAPVGSYAPNSFGLYDMHGNVSEWCGRSDSNYFLRGGSWSDDPWLCRSAFSHHSNPNTHDSNYGFRVACHAFISPSSSLDLESPQKVETSSAISIPLVSNPSLIVPDENPKTFSFEVVTINRRGEITKKETKEAQYYTETLPGGVELDMVAIPGGSFIMGAPASEEGSSDSERPQHQVTLSPFYMGKYPITQSQYQAIMGNNPSEFKGDNRPVENVFWHDAVEFCQKLSQATGKDYRLPSEAQWEYACRVGTTTPFHFGETITTHLANYNGNYTYGEASKGKYRKQTTDVGSFPPNSFGLHDMHGNVWEWCEDGWHDNYQGAPTDGSAWNIGGNQNRRVLRGGSWYYFPRYCRSADRVNLTPGFRDYYFGFRVLCAVVPGLS